VIASEMVSLDAVIASCAANESFFQPGPLTVYE
jgi:hypothetical protein